MDTKISLFYGVLRFEPIAMLLCIAGAGVFFLSWYRSYVRTGWKIDFWHFTILLNVFIPILLMYPVSSSELQSAAVGSAWPDVEQKIDVALEISSFGYLSFLVGRFVFDAIMPSRASVLVSSVFGKLETMVERNIKSGSTTIFLSILILPLLIAVSYIAFEAGPFRAREYFLENVSFRSLYNLLISAYPLLPLYFWLKNKDRMRFSKYLVLIFLVFGSLFLGTRGVLVASVLQLFLFYAFGRMGRVSMFRAGLLFFGLAVVSIILSALRGESSVAGAVLALGLNLFYGNNLSDLRDFAWTLATWDGNLFFGKTYIAALLGFIPRALSTFREEWAIGVVTARLAGFSPEEHAGIRPGIFGEAYLNFGLAGVFAISFANGYLLRYADWQIKLRVKQKNGIVAAYAATIPYVISSAFLLTSGFWSVYVLICVHIFSAIFRVATRAKNHNEKQTHYMIKVT